MVIKCDIEIMEKEYKHINRKCREEININHNYTLAYDYAVQAKYIAENFLDNEMYVIESEMLRGLSYLRIDNLIGHDILNNLYKNSLEKMNGNIKLQLRLKTAIGRAKRELGEYEESLNLLFEVVEICQTEVKKAEEKNVPADNFIKGIISYMNEITINLIFKSRQKKYPFQVKRIENRIKQMDLANIDEIQKEFNKVYYINEINHDLVEAENYINEALSIARKHHFNELELVSTINYACILIEKEDYSEALKILENIVEEEYVIENCLGSVLNELGITYICTGKLEMGMGILHKAWNWLSEKKNYDELNRNIYATALYYYKMGNLDLAYSFGELAYSRDSDICSLRLLYEITLLKYLKARVYGDESEYAFYRSEYDKYSEKIQRRA